MMSNIICGPILRACQAHFFSFQLVLDRKVNLSVELSHEGQVVQDTTTHIRIKSLSDELVLYFVKVECQLSLGRHYHYDILYIQNSILNDGRFAYDGKLPGFSVGANHLAFGSCRKLDANDFDSLAHLAKNDARPEALFLMGDQIYADDLEDELLDKLCELVEQYGLDKELSKREEVISPKSYQKESLAKASELNRQKIVNSWGLTSAKADNHLLLAAEYFFLYILSWSDYFWQEKDDGFLNDLAAVRVLLANVPVYMQMDDHDITDDLNINQHWRERVLDNSKYEEGVNLLSKAYAVGYLMQIWGNEAKYDAYFDLCFDYDWSSVPSRDIYLNADWNMSFCTGDKHVLQLDTRNFRVHGKGFQEAAGLIDPQKIKKLLSPIKSKELVLISPSPVYGFEPIEKLQKWLNPFKDAVYRIDREGWGAPKEGEQGKESLKALENELTKFDKVYIFSGDVHYSFCCKNNNIVQVVTSPLKNHPPLTLLARLYFYFYNQFSKRNDHIKSDRNKKILQFSNYCSFDFRRADKIEVYCRNNKHRFKE